MENPLSARFMRCLEGAQNAADEAQNAADEAQNAADAEERTKSCYYEVFVDIMNVVEEEGQISRERVDDILENNDLNFEEAKTDLSKPAEESAEESAVKGRSSPDDYLHSFGKLIEELMLNERNNFLRVLLFYFTVSFVCSVSCILSFSIFVEGVVISAYIATNDNVFLLNTLINFVIMMSFCSGSGLILHQLCWGGYCSKKSGRKKVGQLTILCIATFVSCAFNFILLSTGISITVTKYLIGFKHVDEFLIFEGVGIAFVVFVFTSVFCFLCLILVTPNWAKAIAGDIVKDVHKECSRSGPDFFDDYGKKIYKKWWKEAMKEEKARSDAQSIESKNTDNDKIERITTLRDLIDENNLESSDDEN